MPRYELMYLLGSHVAENEVPVISSQILKNLEELGGTNVEETQLGKKKLAYPIKKTRNGYYVVVNFNMDTAKINEFDAKIRSINSSVIRYLLINLDEHLERTQKDKVAQAILSKRQAQGAEEKEKKKIAEAPKAPAIKLEDIDEKMLDEKIEKALSEDITK